MNFESSLGLLYRLDSRRNSQVLFAFVMKFQCLQPMDWLSCIRCVTCFDRIWGFWRNNRQISFCGLSMIFLNCGLIYQGFSCWSKKTCWERMWDERRPMLSPWCLWFFLLKNVIFVWRMMISLLLQIFLSLLAYCRAFIYFVKSILNLLNFNMKIWN